MELLNPSLGIIFWTCLSFLIILVLLSKFAWKPIIAELKKRESKISASLEQAKEIEENLRRTKEQSEKMIAEATQESRNILSDAKKQYNDILAGASADAKKEAERISKQTIQQMELEKQQMIKEIKEQAANIVVEVAEKVLISQLENKKKSQQFAEKMISQVSFTD